jgi:hypothetical protein
MEFVIVGIIFVAFIAAGMYLGHVHGSAVAAVVSTDVEKMKADLAAVKAKVEAAEALSKK